MRRVLFLSSRLKTCLVLTAMSASLLADEHADLKADFKAQWNERRNVAPFVRCKVQIVRVIPAGLINSSPTFPPTDVAVEQSREYLFDMKNRRLRLRSDYWAGYHRTELRHYRNIWFHTRQTMQRFQFDVDGAATPKSTAIVDLSPDGRNVFLDAAMRFSPEAFAVGFTPYCGLASHQTRPNDFEIKVLDKGLLELTPIEEERVRYVAQPNQNWAISKASFLTRSTDGRIIPGYNEVEVVAKWEEFPQGWYPTSWKQEMGDETESCKATWEFLEAVDKALWEAPIGKQVPEGKMIENVAPAN